MVRDLNYEDGYILEFSFKLDFVNEFCKKDYKERYIFFAQPHAIIIDKNCPQVIIKGSVSKKLPNGSRMVTLFLVNGEFNGELILNG